MQFSSIPEHVQVSLSTGGCHIRFTSKHREPFIEFAERVAERVGARAVGGVSLVRCTLTPEPDNLDYLSGVPQAIYVFLIQNSAMQGQYQPKAITVFQTRTEVGLDDPLSEDPPAVEYTYHLSLGLAEL